MLPEFSMNYLQKSQKSSTVVRKSPFVGREALVLQSRNMLPSTQHELRVKSNSLQISNILQTSNKTFHKQTVVLILFQSIWAIL